MLNSEGINTFYGFSDERAQVELAVNTTTQVMEKYLLLSVDTDTSHVESCNKSCDEVLCFVSFLPKRCFMNVRASYMFF